MTNVPRPTYSCTLLDASYLLILPEYGHSYLKNLFSLKLSLSTWGVADIVQRSQGELHTINMNMGGVKENQMYDDTH